MNTNTYVPLLFPRHLRRERVRRMTAISEPRKNYGTVCVNKNCFKALYCSWSSRIYKEVETFRKASQLRLLEQFKNDKINQIIKRFNLNSILRSKNCDVAVIIIK